MARRRCTAARQTSDGGPPALWRRALSIAGGLWLGLTAAGCAPEPPAGDDEIGVIAALQAPVDDRDRPCFHPELGDFDISCLTNAEIAALLSDFDHDGRSNLDELKLGTDPYNSSDGPDVDMDGILNVEDDDVDGDGVPNKRDFDVDGDRVFNDHDHDIDADGLIGDDDADDDGDGLSDRFDLDDDGDDDPDDEDDDDDDDQPKEKLEDLIERLKTGALTDADKNAIATEISERLGKLEDQAAFQAALIDVIAQSMSDVRAEVDGDIPPGVAAVDAVYRQLADSLAYVKGRQDDPNAPLDREKLGEVARDFLPRAQAVAGLGRTFQTLPIDDLSAAVSDLRAASGAQRFPEVAQGLATLVALGSRGSPDDERRELGLITEGVTRLARAFSEAPGSELIDALDRLRDLSGDDLDLQAAGLNRLLSRMEEIADEQLATLGDALDQVVDEELADDAGSEEDAGAEESGDNGP